MKSIKHTIMKKLTRKNLNTLAAVMPVLSAL